ncbi:MAG: superoxide dismutase family protein [Gemmatimonadota bacterium]
MRRLAILLALTACGGQTNDPAAGARADFVDRNGNRIGNATLYQEIGAVRIRLTVDELGPNAHGFHIHAVGRCEAPFESAGSHFNPTGRKHGNLDPEGMHAGDLINLPAGSMGSGKVVETTAPGVSLESLFDADGSALVIHENPDDYRTDPSGNSGARIACAVIRRP